MPEINLEERVKELESIIGIDKNDIARNAFISFCKMVASQTNLLNNFKLDTEIKKIPAKDGDKIYDRTMAIHDGMPKMIENVLNLRDKLKISNKEIEEAFVDNIAETRK